MLKGAAIRQSYLDFFKRHQHLIVDSAPVVPHDDPTLMFDVYHDPWFPDADAGPGPGGSFSGWDVVDYAYEAQNANASNLMVQVPTLRTIHGVYFKSDFSKLNI